MNKLILWLCIIITFSSFPYIGNYLFGQFYVVVSTGLIVSFAFLVLSNDYYKSVLPKEFQLWFYLWVIYGVSVCFYAILLFVRENTLDDLRRCFGLFFKLLFVISASLVIVKQRLVVDLFLKINYYIAVGSLILLVLLILGINVPSITFVKIDGRDHFFYFIGASNAVYHWDGFSALRLAGFADEPGAFALMLNYFLIINEITLKSKKYRVIFTLAGIFTFSLAFYLTLIFFLIYWVMIRIISLKRILLFVGILLLITLLVNTIYPIEAFNKLFDMFFERFKYNEDTGRYEGDNRSESFALQINAFFDNWLLGIGDNLEVKNRYELYNPSIIGYLANYGLYGLFFFMLPVYSIVARYLFRKEILLILALLATYMQRPGVEDMFSMLSLSIIYFFSFSNEQQKFVKI